MRSAKAEEPGDIFSDAEATPRDERGASPPPDPLAEDRATAAADGGSGGPRPSPKPADGGRAATSGAGGAERTDGADEERRLRLRQVKIPSSLCRMVAEGAFDAGTYRLGRMPFTKYQGRLLPLLA